MSLDGLTHAANSGSSTQNAANNGTTPSTGCSVSGSCGPTANTHGMSHCSVTVNQNGKYTTYDGGPTGSIWNSTLQVQSGPGGPPGANTFYISDSCSMAGVSRELLSRSTTPRCGIPSRLALVDPFGDDCYDPSGNNTGAANDQECAQQSPNNQWIDIPQTTGVNAAPPADIPTIPANPYDNPQVTTAINGQQQGANGSQAQSGNSQGGGGSTAANNTVTNPFKPKPLSAWDKTGMVISCIFGMDPDNAKPIVVGGDSQPSDSTDSTNTTEGQGAPTGPNKSGRPVPYGGDSEVPGGVAGGASVRA